MVLSDGTSQGFSSQGWKELSLFPHWHWGKEHQDPPNLEAQCLSYLLLLMCHLVDTDYSKARLGYTRVSAVQKCFFNTTLQHTPSCSNLSCAWCCLEAGLQQLISPLVQSPSPYPHHRLSKRLISQSLRWWPLGFIFTDIPTVWALSHKGRDWPCNHWDPLTHVTIRSTLCLGQLIVSMPLGLFEVHLLEEDCSLLGERDYFSNFWISSSGCILQAVFLRSHSIYARQFHTLNCNSLPSVQHVIVAASFYTYLAKALAMC